MFKINLVNPKKKYAHCFSLNLTVPLTLNLVHQQDGWTDGRRWQLTVATELPELEEKQFTNRGGGFGGGNRGGSRGGGFRGGRGRGFGGSGGRSNGFRSGGFNNNSNVKGVHKRDFGEAFDY